MKTPPKIVEGASKCGASTLKGPTLMDRKGAKVEELLYRKGANVKDRGGAS